MNIKVWWQKQKWEEEENSKTQNQNVPEKNLKQR